MAQDRNLQILGLAKKAGLLAIGEESAGVAARSGRAVLIISASDASERALRNAKINAEAGFALCAEVPYTKFELGNMTGRGSPGTVAFLDTGLATRFLKGLAQTQPEPFKELWEYLESPPPQERHREKPARQADSTPTGNTSGNRRTMQ
ncbi:MAG: 50S ribosomal protein L7 [Oscillospiraceae bacterium]|nr:50S ribosomal protein L7 [Oscillospiraceae bacterium]